MKYSLILKIFIPILFLVIAEIIVITEFSSNLHKSKLYEESVSSAIQAAKQYKEIRSYYNDYVVSKISQNSGILIDLNHKNIPNTIPLPATMIHDLSEIVNKKLNGMQIKIYSDYPFPNRINRKLDDFEKSSMQYFRNNKSREPRISQETQNGLEVIRVAIADEMTSLTCVDCHNSYLDTPKNDWKLDDIRGVLEVIIPLQTQINNNNTVTKYINITVIASSLIVLIMIYLIILHFSKIEREDKDKLLQKQKKLNKAILSFDKNVISLSADLNGVITYVSQALCDISGYDKEELLGKSHNILRHPDMSKETYKELWTEIKKGNTWDGEIRNKKKNGGYYWVRTTIIPEYDNDKLIGYSSIRHDITAQKVKEEFFSNMSHELRTPLNAILGFVGILGKQIDDKKHKDYLKYIGSNSQQLLSLINDILDLSKINNGDFTIDKYKSNAYDEITNNINRFNGVLASSYILFSFNIDKHLQGVFIADWLRVSQIILNLVSNAIKFTPNNGMISLDVDYIDKSLVIVVTDTGIGMSPEVQDKIFKPFVQADGSTTRKYGGTGLGLSITQNLIEMMQGKLEVESVEGEGSSFTVEIPVEKISSDIVTHEEINFDEIQNIPLSGRVLVAEDNKTNQLLVKLLLEDMGVECDIAEDGAKALKMYDPSIHELILMDENMPNMNGVVAMHKIREKYKDDCGPIIALTANVMKGDKERFIKEGMDDYIPKPIDENHLNKVLTKFLKKKD
ncbi:MAG: ATP-binding protein [Sulfurimonas sp.]|nr:ATP-binding protein [Sulfurimonas sp.]